MHVNGGPRQKSNINYAATEIVRLSKSVLTINPVCLRFLMLRFKYLFSIAYLLSIVTNSQSGVQYLTYIYISVDYVHDYSLKSRLSLIFINLLPSIMVIYFNIGLRILWRLRLEWSWEAGFRLPNVAWFLMFEFPCWTRGNEVACLKHTYTLAIVLETFDLSTFLTFDEHYFIIFISFPYVIPFVL